MKYRIWSIEHNAWWKPDHNGYTLSIHSAGIYDEAEALDIVEHANQFTADKPNEALVPVPVVV